jgi:hypothetical protein
MEIHEERKLFDKMKCVICGNHVTLHRNYTISKNNNGETLINNKPISEYKPESQMWEDGVISLFYGGYGSVFDGDIFYLAICDECIAKKYKDGSIFFAGDYMFDQRNYEENDYDITRRKVLRDNNLNDLIDENKK